MVISACWNFISRGRNRYRYLASDYDYDNRFADHERYNDELVAVKVPKTPPAVNSMSRTGST
jgi:hypothetical protein